MNFKIGCQAIIDICDAQVFGEPEVNEIRRQAVKLLKGVSDGEGHREGVDKKGAEAVQAGPALLRADDGADADFGARFSGLDKLKFELIEIGEFMEEIKS